ncbi:acyltransferase family protein [Streptosporangium saharense]|uniref:acyltransferase family protein n=1 Tax=Streptosporangium saharense TaxID=1706840 RepID=UPI00367A2DD5
MRFVAATMVFALHVMVEGIFASGASHPTLFKMLALGGGAGVGFFFVLSGFVLTWSARSDDTPRTFWRRRFFKIYPNHLLTFLAALLVITLVVGNAVGLADAVRNLFLLQAFFPQAQTITSVNPVAWSLSCEAFFYLCFPLLLGLVRRIRPERLWRWAAGVVVVIFLVPLASGLLPAQQPYPILGVTEWETWFIYHFPPVRMLDFVFGILLAQMVLTGRRIPLGYRGSVLLSVVVYALTPLIPPTYAFVAALCVPLGLVIANGAVADRDGRRTGLSGRVWVWLGEVSFAFYMWHRLVLITGHDLLGAGGAWPAPTAFAISVLLFCVTLFVSWLTFSLFERPVMRRFGTAGGTWRARSGGGQVDAKV